LAFFLTNDNKQNTSKSNSMPERSCSFKTILEKVAAEKSPGPSATFNILHIIIAIQTIFEENCGRIRLSERLGLGEGATRTIMRRLKEEGLVTTSKKGCSLTKKGIQLWQGYRSVYEKTVAFGKNELTNCRYNYAVLIRKREVAIESGIMQRDAAVKAGARSAITMMFKDGKLRIPTVSDDVLKDFPTMSSELIRLLHPDEDDVIIIGSADNPREAEHGTLAAALTLCR
jgi:predicted transcriptional regulator